MKSKKIAITVCTIAVVVLAVFIGTKLMTNTNDDPNLATSEVVNSSMDLTGEVTKEKENGKEEEKKTMEEEVKEDNSNSTETNESKDDEIDQTTDKIKESDNLLFEKEEDREEDKKETSSIDENTKKSVEVFSDMYTVKDNETLSQIAKTCLERNNLDLDNALFFNRAIDVIIGINSIENPNVIIAGTKLYMPTVNAFEGILPDGDAYEVKEGDTLFSIVRNEMSWCEDIAKAKEAVMNNNKIENENSIQAGSVIYIPEENSEF